MKLDKTRRTENFAFGLFESCNLLTVVDFEFEYRLPIFERAYSFLSNFVISYNTANQFSLFWPWSPQNSFPARIVFSFKWKCFVKTIVTQCLQIVASLSRYLLRKNWKHKDLISQRNINITQPYWFLLSPLNTVFYWQFERTWEASWFKSIAKRRWLKGLAVSLPSNPWKR